MYLELAWGNIKTSKLSLKIICNCVFKGDVLLQILMKFKISNIWGPIIHCHAAGCSMVASSPVSSLPIRDLVNRES